jgi:hypothetical protein
MVRRTKRYLIGSVAVVAVFVAFLVEERVRGHLALRAWERGMRGRGEKLTIAELAPPITNTAVRVLTSGQFLALYSVGMDGEDDGGNPEPRQGTSVSVFQGRDWVWEQPADGAALEAASRRPPAGRGSTLVRPPPARGS